MIVSRSDNGALVRISNGELAEIQGYAACADAAFSHEAKDAEMRELHAIKRWVEHLLRLAENATPDSPAQVTADGKSAAEQDPPTTVAP